MMETLIGKIQWSFLARFLRASLLMSLLKPQQGMLVDELGMIRAQMGSTTLGKWPRLHGTLCTIHLIIVTSTFTTCLMQEFYVICYMASDYL
jgi:hypothetical protein